MKKIIFSFLIFFACSSLAQAACDFLINIGDKGTKVFEKFAPPMPGFKGQFYLPIQSPEVCPNDKLNDMIAVEYVFLGEEEDTAQLAAIRMVVLNDGNNTESDKLTLMNYAKKVYGDFDTGGNPEFYNNFNIWEKVQKYIVYNRRLIGNFWEEEIYISSDKYYEQLVQYENEQESIEPVENEN